MRAVRAASFLSANALCASFVCLCEARAERQWLPAHDSDYRKGN